MAVQDQIGKVREAVPRSVTFLQEVWAELKKVHWPTRKETYAATVVVLVHRRARRPLPWRRRFCSLSQVVQADPALSGRHGKAVVRGPYLLGVRAEGEGRARGAGPSARARRSYFGEVLVPAEKVVELVKGRKKTSSRMFFPGYILVNMELNDETWHIVKSTPKVTGFVGGATKPAPISESEVREITDQMEEGAVRPKPKVLFENGRARQGRRRSLPGLQRRGRRGQAGQG